MKPFRERNPIPIAVVGLALIALGLLAAFQAQNLPFIGGGSTYSADFADVGGLALGDDVRIAGVKVGSVTGMHLAGGQVLVTMRVRPHTVLGPATRADVKIKTLLGTEFVALTPGGRGPLRHTIPLARTTVPLTVPAAFQGLARRVGQIDTARLAQAFDVLAATFKNAPPYVTSSLAGLSRLSATVYSRDQQLARLLANANDVTGVLAGRSSQITQVINNGDLVLQLVEQQRQQIHDLFVNSARLGVQLSGLVAENRSALAPALSNLHGVLAILQRDQVQLGQFVHLLGPFVRLFTNTLAQGRWFDTFIVNLAAAPGGLQLTGGSGPPLNLPTAPLSGGVR